MKFTRTLGLMAALCCVPASIAVTGCGGGNSTLPAGTVAGSYTGSYEVTDGPDDGETGPLSLTITGDGNIAGTVTDDNNNTATFSGTASTTSGRFTVNGLFGLTGTNGQATGEIRLDGSTVRGSGTFSISNGNRGNVVFSKISVND